MVRKNQGPRSTLTIDTSSPVRNQQWNHQCCMGVESNIRSTGASDFCSMILHNFVSLFRHCTIYWLQDVVVFFRLQESSQWQEVFWILKTNARIEYFIVLKTHIDTNFHISCYRDGCCSMEGQIQRWTIPISFDQSMSWGQSFHAWFLSSHKWSMCSIIRKIFIVVP